MVHLCVLFLQGKHLSLLGQFLATHPLQCPKQIRQPPPAPSPKKGVGADPMMLLVYRDPPPSLPFSVEIALGIPDVCRFRVGGSLLLLLIFAVVNTQFHSC